MGEKITSIINEHWCRALLEKDELDYSKFYRNQIEQFLDVSREDTKKYKIRNCKAIELVKSLIIFWKKYSPDNTMEIGQFEKVLSTLQGDDKE